MSTVVFVLLLGVAIAITTHMGKQAIEQRAQERYQTLMGDLKTELSHDDIWEEIRSLTRGWVCLTIALPFLRALGIIAQLSATLHMLSRI